MLRGVRRPARAESCETPCPSASARFDARRSDGFRPMLRGGRPSGFDRRVAIETLLHTDRSLAAATRLVLDKLQGKSLENVDGPDDGRIEVDCLDGDTGD